MKNKSNNVNVQGRSRRLPAGAAALLLPGVLWLAACSGQGESANNATSAAALGNTQVASAQVQPAPAKTVTVERTAQPRPTPVVERGQPGEVVAVEPIVETDRPSGAGAVLGGVIGGVLGHQVGGGNGQKAATAVGAVGGAVLGHKIEKDRSSHVTGYTIAVRTRDGTLHNFRRDSDAGLQPGTQVRVVDGQLRLRS